MVRFKAKTPQEAEKWVDAISNNVSILAAEWAKKLAQAQGARTGD
jgi:hypothetical protein